MLLFALALAFATFSVTIAPFVGPKRFNRAKLDFYECGIEPTPQPLGPHRFPIKYFLTAMLFIIFDIEIIFLYPWAVANRALGLFGLVEMVPVHRHGVRRIRLRMAARRPGLGLTVFHPPHVWLSGRLLRPGGQNRIT